jgi:hypothetical protein
LTAVLFVFIKGSILDWLIRKFVDLHFEDAVGKKVDRIGYMKVRGFYTYYFTKPPVKNLKLVFTMETPASNLSVLFSVKDIILPL